MRWCGNGPNAASVSVNKEKQAQERTAFRQNSNLLITYIFFYIRKRSVEGFGRGHQDGFLQKDAFSTGGEATRPPLVSTNKNCISQSFPWRAEVSKASNFVHTSEAIHPFAHNWIVHISLHYVMAYSKERASENKTI